MKKERKKYWWVLIFFMSIPILVQANTEDERLDRFMSDLKLKVYSKPLEVIRVGDSLYNSDENGIKEKSAGLLLIADALISLRNYSQAMEYIEIANELLEDSSYANSKTKVLSRMAYIYFQLGLHNEALGYLKKARAENKHIAEEGVFNANAGYILTVEGLVYRDIADCQMAMRYFRKALKAFAQSAEHISKVNQSVVYYNMGNCYLSLENFDAAQENFEEAYNVVRKFKAEQSSLKLFAQKGLASIFIAKEEYQKAIEILNELYENGIKIDDKSLLRSVSSDLSTSYLQLEDWEQFNFYAQKAKTFDREILEYKKKATRNALDGVDKYQLKIAEKEEKRVTNQIFIMLFTFAVLIGGIGIAIFRKRKNITRLHSEIYKA